MRAHQQALSRTCRYSLNLGSTSTSASPIFMITALPRFTVLLPSTGSSTAGQRKRMHTMLRSSSKHLHCRSSPPGQRHASCAEVAGQLHGTQERVGPVSALLTCVDVNRQVLKQQRYAVLNAVDDLVNVLGLALLHNDKAGCRLPVFDPLDTLCSKTARAQSCFMSNLGWRDAASAAVRRH